MFGGGGIGGPSDQKNNEQLSPSQSSTAASSPTKSTHSFSGGGVATGGKSLQSGITPDTSSSGIFSPQQASRDCEDDGNEEYDDVEPEGAYESCPLLG